MREMAREELRGERKSEQLEQRFTGTAAAENRTMNETRSPVRAGTGGDEAALFAGDLFMYGCVMPGL